MLLLLLLRLLADTLSVHAPNWKLKHDLHSHDGCGIRRRNSPLVLLAFGFFSVFVGGYVSVSWIV
jgi:hypothetical protein